MVLLRSVAASYQALGNLDSVLNVSESRAESVRPHIDSYSHEQFPVYYGVADAFFPTPGTTLNMSSLVEIYSAAQQAFPVGQCYRMPLASRTDNPPIGYRCSR